MENTDGTCGAISNIRSASHLLLQTSFCWHGRVQMTVCCAMCVVTWTADCGVFTERLMWLRLALVTCMHE